MRGRGADKDHEASSHMGTNLEYLGEIGEARIKAGSGGGQSRIRVRGAEIQDMGVRGSQVRGAPPPGIMESVSGQGDAYWGLGWSLKLGSGGDERSVGSKWAQGLPSPAPSQPSGVGGVLTSCPARLGPRAPGGPCGRQPHPCGARSPRGTRGCCAHACAGPP